MLIEIYRLYIHICLFSFSYFSVNTYHLNHSVSFQDPAALVIDHTSYAVSETEGDHTLIASDIFIESTAILGDKKIEVKMNLSSLLFMFFN